VGNNDILKLYASALIGILAAFLIAAVVVIFVVQGTANTNYQRELGSAQATAVETLFNRRIAELQLQLNTLASNPELVTMIEEGDPGNLADREKIVSTLIPGAIKVRLFAKGMAKVNRETTPPFSFTSLDMVNRAESGELVYPEAINTEGRWILAIASPIRMTPQDRAVGSLFTYLSLTSLPTELPDGVDGEVTIMQQFGNNPANEVFRTGSPPADSLDTITRSMDSPSWTLLYRPGTTTELAEAVSLVLGLVPTLVFLVLAVVAVILGGIRGMATLKSDLAQLADVLEGQIKPGDTQFNLDAIKQFNPILSSLFGVPLTPGNIEIEEDKVAAIAKATQSGIQPVADQMVEIELIDEDEFEDQLRGTSEPTFLEEEDESADAIAEIFRAYDIRGVVNETLTPAVIHKIGLAIGTEADERGCQTLVVAADGRVSSPDVMESLIAGLLESGRDVVNLGSVPTPVLYFALSNSETSSGVMITGSHNPPEYNGFKVVLDGVTLIEEDIQKLYMHFLSENFSEGMGSVSEADIRDDYTDAIIDDVVIAQPLKVVLDCGNGIPGEIMPDLLANLGCDVVPIYCEVDGTFPNHPPDPTVPANLEDLILTVKSQDADLGIALDGDGDRVIAVTREGEIIWPDQLLMLFAKDVVSRNPGSDVVYDVKCTRHLNSIISGFGGRPIMSRSGHSYVKAKMRETGAVLGGEFSGHICFGERWFGFDDGLYAAARLLEIVGSSTAGLTELINEFPSSISTPEIQIEVGEQDKFLIVDKLVAAADFEDSTITTIDGLRADFSDGWGLVRASNTGPNLTLRFEADNQEALLRIKKLFKEQLQDIDQSLEF